MRGRLVLALFISTFGLWAQQSKFKNVEFPVASGQMHIHKILEWPTASLPYQGRNLLQSASNPIKQISGSSLPTRRSAFVVTESGKNGLPSRCKMKVLGTRSQQTLDASFLATELKRLMDPLGALGMEWKLFSESVDELGIRHLRFEQQFDGYPVEGGEYLVHVYLTGEAIAHGAALLPDQTTILKVSLQQAVDFAMKGLQENGIYCTSPMPEQPKYIKTGLEANRLIYAFIHSLDKFRLVHELKIFPNPTQKYLVWIDAETGTILKQRSDYCHFHSNVTNKCSHSESNSEFNPEGGETIVAKDLFDVNRTLNVWREGSFQYLIDASRAMFKSSSFKLDNPVGAIWTLDALNSDPDNIKIDQVKSNNNTWSKTAISAHYNGGLAYEYFLNTHTRNSINGKGGTIISIINVAEKGGRGMDNAFWNGEAMFYGNGATAFNSLAKGLDVAGHEMSHGVIESTANLTYENESGAINESFADVFGSMIDRDDWKIGEDVVKLSAFPSGALRDMSNPHNGAQAGDYSKWQPNHVNEQYKGTLDNGGVHINSGIPNHAFYLFVRELAKSGTEEQGKKTAEKVYYRALVQYLTRSSNFKDLRNAVEQACIDFHGSNSSVHNAAKLAFDQVGIGGSGTPGGGGQQYQKDLQVNPGKAFVICTDQNDEGIYLIDVASGKITQLSSVSLKSKPSISDNGSTIVYVGKDAKLYLMDYNTSLGRYEEFLLDADPIYRNASISKDGRLLSVLYNLEENKIHVYDFFKKSWKTFTLTNPTTSTGGVSTANVRYADFMDFQHSGENLVYDARSKLDRNTGGSYEYWDIGFLRVWDPVKNEFGDGHIEKLFSDLPENTSIGNPSFSKNSPYIIAFDYLEEDLFGSVFYIIGANIETGSSMEIAGNRDDTGYPNYSVDDKFLMYDGYNNSGDVSLKYKALAANKIQASGNEQLYLSEAHWGSFFANGDRVLVKNDEASLVQSVAVYPNPFTSGFILELTSSKDDEYTLELKNGMGQTMQSRIQKLVTGNNKLIWEDQAQLPNGVYFLLIRNGKEMTTVPLIKQ